MDFEQNVNQNKKFFDLQVTPIFAYFTAFPETFFLTFLFPTLFFSSQTHLRILFRTGDSGGAGPVRIEFPLVYESNRISEPLTPTRSALSTLYGYIEVPQPKHASFL